MSAGKYTNDDWVHYWTLALVKAWRDEGSYPWYHRHVKKWLKRKWPLLYDAVNGLVISEEQRGTA